jgi:predicted transcriptional regulator of viral defense system
MDLVTFRKSYSAIRRKSGGVIRTEEVPDILGIPAVATRKLLSRWESQGWIIRLRRGVYLPLPLEAQSSKQWTEDPWIIATILFEPCYIGGWSACEYWNLTEQIFREVLVVTSRAIRKKEQEVLANRFRLKRVLPKRLFGTAIVWKGQTKIKVSDPSRTIVDLFDNPSLGGGFLQAVSVLSEYIRSKDRDLMQILQYTQTNGNRTVFKRLGYIFEQRYPDEKDFIKECFKRIGKGYSKLDPTSPPKGSYLRRWNLQINKDVSLA